MDSSVQLFNPANAPVASGYPDWYSYVVNFTALTGGVAAGTPASQTFQIDASAQFFWTQLSYQADAILGTSTYTWNTNPIPLVTFLITDGGSQKQLMSAPVYLNCLAGFGGWPYRLQHPRLFNSNSSVTVNVVNYDATTYGSLQLVFGGFRVYAS
jgi:hypothetical protein